MQNPGEEVPYRLIPGLAYGLDGLLDVLDGLLHHEPGLLKFWPGRDISPEHLNPPLQLFCAVFGLFAYLSCLGQEAQVLRRRRNHRKS